MTGWVEGILSCFFRFLNVFTTLLMSHGGAKMIQVVTAVNGIAFSSLDWLRCLLQKSSNVVGPLFSVHLASSRLSMSALGGTRPEFWRHCLASRTVVRSLFGWESFVKLPDFFCQMLCCLRCMSGLGFWGLIDWEASGARRSGSVWNLVAPEHLGRCRLNGVC